MACFLQVLFNYFQLNSVALTADVAWKGVMESLLSIQSKRLLAILSFADMLLCSDGGESI